MEATAEEEMKVWVRKNKAHFDEEAWSLIVRAAQRDHRTPKQVVIAAIRRGIKLCKAKKS